MIYPLNAFRKKTATVKDTEFPFYEVSMWTTNPYCPKCGSNKKISIDHKIQEPIEGFDLVQDEPSKVSVVDACFFRCHNKSNCTGSRFEDPWLPFGTGGQKFSVQYYQYLIDTYLLEGLTIKEIKSRYMKEISKPLANAICNCKKAVMNFLDCRELWFIQTSYLGDERCIVLGIPAVGDNNPVLLTVCAAPAEINSFSRKIQKDRIKTIACECKPEYFYAIKDAFFPQPDELDIQVVLNRNLLKDTIDEAATADKVKWEKKYRDDFDEAVKAERSQKKRLSRDYLSKIEYKYTSMADDMEAAALAIRDAIHACYDNLLAKNSEEIKKTLVQEIKSAYKSTDQIEKACAYEDFADNFPALYGIASLAGILKAKDSCKILNDTAANLLKTDVMERLQKFETNKVPFDVAVLKLLFGDHTNFHRRLAENSAYADFLKKCYEQRKKVEKGYHKMKLSLSDQMDFSSEGSNIMDPSKQISMTDFFSAMAPYRELEYYSAMLQFLKAGDVHVADQDIPEWEMIVAAVSDEITPWQYPPIWQDVHTVIPIDLEKI